MATDEKEKDDKKTQAEQDKEFKEKNPTAGGPDVGQTPANKPGMSHD